jgi:hypothetical protein
MNKTEYTINVIKTIRDKTRQGKIIWREELQGNTQVILARPTSNLQAIFRMDKVSPFEAAWQRFILYQDGEELAQVFNPALLAGKLAPNEFSTQAAEILSDLFNQIAVEPRVQKLTQTLEELDNL